jgi:hypothetical protein
MRRHDWASRMHAVIDAHRCRPFAWGDNDCCLFVARVVDAMTDSEYERAILEHYRDEETGRALIGKHGGMLGAVTAFLGDPVPQRAARGDVVLIDGGEGEALGICMGRDVVAVGESGLRAIPRKDALKVWKP